MSKAKAAPQSRWKQICARIGVEPKQFAVLCAVGGGAMTILAGKFLLGGPKEATATPEAPAAPAPAAPVPAPAPATPGSAFDLTDPPADPSSGALVVRLDTHPVRDPFKSFAEKPPAPAADPSQAPPDSALTPPDLSTLVLRATMDGEWVIINKDTYRVGDVIGKAPDGTPIYLREVGHRRAVVEWRTKTFDIFFTK